MTARVPSRPLPCALSDDERSAVAVTLAETVAKHHRARVQAVRARRRMRALEETMDDLSGQLRSGQVVRKVQINDRKVLDRGVMETVRIDTGAVIESRPLTEDEKQPDLPF